MHVGQTKIAAGVTVGQLLVVETQQMQDRRVQVVNVDSAFDGVPTKLISRPMNVARFDTAAGEAHREAVVIVIATIRCA